MECNEIRRLVDETYAPKRIAHLPLDAERHLKTCGECSAFFESLRLTERLLAHLPRVSPSKEIMARLIEVERGDRARRISPKPRLIGWVYGAYLAGGIAAVVLSVLPPSLPTLTLSFALVVTALTSTSVHLLKRPILGR